ncbi:hypothetical protein HQN86_12855 [Pedobacter panaciterrae]|uniref:hypothetical protein n=1 Tax=Pedobacter panaciterrae TaxID=363849 RepID=UPI00155DC916|nr:hypothetical protein [Pedobacter panaciterrae]NQX54507.1 hypothetical protein [Pedobacter panaciterrae]
METNYFIEGLVVLLVVLLVIFLINRNKKDLTKYEEDVNKSEISPKNNENHI